MQTERTGSPLPGPRDARGLQLGISCLGLFSFITGGFAGILFLAWAIYRRDSSLAFPFPTPGLLGFVPPLASIWLGVWTWHANKVWRLASIIAILAGVVGLGFVVIDGFIFFVR